MKIYLHRSMLIGFSISIIVILGLALTSYLYFNKMMEVTKWAAHARRVLYHAEQVRSFVTEIETAQKGYGLTGVELLLGNYSGTKSALQTHVRELDSLTLDNQIQHGRMAKLQELVNSRIAFSDKVIRVRKESFENAKDLVLTFEGLNLMAEIKALLNQIQDEENNLITTRSLIAQRQFFQFVYAFIGLIGSVVVILIVLMYMINSSLRSRTLAEEKLKKAEQETANVNRELESFTYSVSHDLRAPLRSINGYAEILKEDQGTKLDEEGHRTIEIISKNAKRMGHLIDDLLGFARLGRTELRKGKIDMNELVESVLTELMDQQKGRAVAFEVKLLEPSLGDISMIRQVWVNLLSNALKYSKNKDVSRIEISCQEEAQPREVVYAVKDNGAGFDMQYKNKLFGVFSRLHNNQEFEGTGVGLALSKRIIERHKGRIWAEAKVNEGAAFYFSIPI